MTAAEEVPGSDEAMQASEPEQASEAEHASEAVPATRTEQAAGEQASGTAPVAPSEPPRKKYRAALIRGGGLVPPTLLAELIRAGATLKPLRAPNALDEAHYRPSAKLDAFIRTRDLTCRFPGCSTPAEYCDVDHTVAHPDGSTHPSNLKCLCRKHHLLKTFWDGWSDQQHPDGTITWTSPSGRTYTTYPGSRIMFPHWDIAADPAPLPNARPSPSANSTPHTSVNRGLMMPQRRRTRAADNAARRKADRALNNRPEVT